LLFIVGSYCHRNPNHDADQKEKVTLSAFFDDCHSHFCQCALYYDIETPISSVTLIFSGCFYIHHPTILFSGGIFKAISEHKLEMD
jgi:hypothetical protein